MGSFGRVILGLSTAGVSEAFRKDKKEEAPAPAPQDSGAAAETAASETEKQKRVGRAQLITSSARGVLGNPNTSSKKLSV